MLPSQLIEICSSNNKELNSGIYMIYCLLTDKAYIGQSKNISRRWTEHRRHLRNGVHVNAYLQNLYNKYGKEALRYIILETTVVNLTEKEIYHTSQVDKDYLINVGAILDVIPPHNKGVSMTEEAKQNLSNKLKGRKMSPEHYANVAESNKGRNLGHRHSEESKEKMSDTRKGRKHSEETKLKMSLARKGKSLPKREPHTGESKQKMSEAHKGQKAWNKGKQMLEETKQKISESMKILRAKQKTVVGIEPTRLIE